MAITQQSRGANIIVTLKTRLMAVVGYCVKDPEDIFGLSVLITP
jgi:hypothetical protein